MLGFCVALFLMFFVEQVKKRNLKLLKPIIMLVLNFIVIFLLFNNTQNENYALEENVKTALSFTVTLSLIAKILFYNLAKLTDFTTKYFDYLSLICFYPLLITIFCSLFKNDKRIAFTSQLAHVVSSAYIKNSEIILL